MRFFKGISALDYSGNESAPLQKEGGTIGIIRRIEPIPGKLLPSRACFRLAQRSNVLNQILYLQPVEKDGHILNHLGNVLAVVSDKISAISGSVVAFSAEVVHATDYYPERIVIIQVSSGI